MIRAIVGTIIGLAIYNHADEIIAWIETVIK
jgi:hypothetical protein